MPMSSLMRQLPLASLCTLAACAGQQHVPPPADSMAAATVVLAARSGRNIDVQKLQFNNKRCFQGYTGLSRGTRAEPMRIDAGAPVFFSARYSSGGTFCEVVLSFTPEAQGRYELSAEYVGKVLSAGSCAMSVASAGTATSPHVATDYWVLRPAGIACIRPIRVGTTEVLPSAPPASAP